MRAHPHSVMRSSKLQCTELRNICHQFSLGDFRCRSQQCYMWFGMMAVLLLVHKCTKVIIRVTEIWKSGLETFQQKSFNLMMGLYSLIGKLFQWMSFLTQSSTFEAPVFTWKNENTRKALFHVQCQHAHTSWCACPKCYVSNCVFSGSSSSPSEHNLSSFKLRPAK